MHPLFDGVALFLSGVAVGWWLSIWRLRALVRELVLEDEPDEEDAEDARDPYWPPFERESRWPE